MRKAFFTLISVILLSTPSLAVKKTEVVVVPPKEYTEWLEGMKKDMLDKGISQATIDKAFERDYYHPEPEVVKKDRKQAEFVLTTTDYLNRIVNELRVKKAREKYKELYPDYKKLEKKDGVGFGYIIAFWGAETNFGTNFGNHEVIEALTQLAYDKRRRDFFTKELYQALKIMDTQGFETKDMQGSWAGAMGNFQFMPSTYNRYAVDYDEDGKIDIWNSFGDAAASASNYLKNMNWDKNTPWGCEVLLPWNFDYALTGRKNLKKVKEWNDMGVKLVNAKKLGFSGDIKAAIIVPEGSKGKAYLILPNFYKIMQWNRSENYALAISTLSDYAKTKQKWKALEKVRGIKVKTEDVMKIQDFINKYDIDKVDEDGQLGTATRDAIKKLQEAMHLSQDGYPSYLLLQKIDNYDEEMGFSFPVQPVKPVGKN